MNTKPDSVTLTVTVTSHAAVDEVLAALNRDATAAKREGDMARAVDLLKQAKARQGDMYQETRLAKFLQQAGRVDEALAEIQWLRDRSTAWAKAMFGHQPASTRLKHQVRWQAELEWDAALICKRAKRPEQEAEHRKRFETLAALRDKLGPVADADQVDQRREREARLPTAVRERIQLRRDAATRSG